MASAVNRGGLVKICESFFSFLIAVEEEVRKTFPVHSADVSGYIDENLKFRAIQSTSTSENVKFQWELVSVNWCPVISTTLLELVLNHYITIQGFSFVKGFLEKYKQSTKRNIQKSKGLRKKINFCGHNE